jgi:hypothetical protein
VPRAPDAPYWAAGAEQMDGVRAVAQAVKQPGADLARVHSEKLSINKNDDLTL